ncbi:MAG: uracil-DNA glycosylase family protein [Anaerolineae bacterium]|nr:uracil-DNA glycosylase family protein [Anaerolineae bacterium]
MFDALDQLHHHLRACRRCVEAGFPVAAPPIFAGPAGAAIMVVGQAPGRVEAGQTHRPFSGPAGKRLFRWLAEAGWDEAEFRAVNYMTAVTKCYPGPHPDGRGDRVPSRAEQELCRPWLEQELALVQPRLIVPVGGLAIARFLGNGTRLEEVVGRAFRRPEDDARLTPWARAHAPAAAQIVPLPHPSGASQWFNVPANQARLRQALDLLRRARDADP